jgi:hypothetical protein
MVRDVLMPTHCERDTSDLVNSPSTPLTRFPGSRDSTPFSGGDSMPARIARAERDEEITTEMVDAGIKALGETHPDDFFTRSETVKAIYVAMRRACRLAFSRATNA